VNTAEVIRDLEAQGPREIKVKCPNGHFIADITLSVIDGQLTTRWGRSKKDLRRRASQGIPALYGAVVVAADRNVVLNCADSHCSYNPTRNDQLLALELAEAALRGHAEYRLKW
jgi:hypothetical protein